MPNDIPFPLQQALRPVQQWLDQDDIVEIFIAPQSVFIERLGAVKIEQHEVAELTVAHISHIATRVAALTHQAVNRETPLLSSTLPDGTRIQAVLPPVAVNGGRIVIRKQVVKRMSLEDYVQMGVFNKTCNRYEAITDDVLQKAALNKTDAVLCQYLCVGDYAAFLKTAVQNPYNILLSGGTSTGKTTFLNMLLQMVPDEGHIVTIEDVQELKPSQSLWTPMVASKGDQGEARASIQDLLEVTLRLSPTRAFLGELRGAEAFTFLRLLNIGSAGSMATIHANSPELAFHQLAFMTLQAGLGLRVDYILQQARALIPIVIQLGSWIDVETGTKQRGISDIYFQSAEALLDRDTA